MPQISEQAFVYAVKVNDNGDGTLSFEQKVVGGDLPVFVNKLKAGSLEIEKTVVDAGKGNPDPDREFTFHVKLKGKNLPKFPDLEDPASDSTSTGSSTGSAFSFRIEWGGGKPATSFKLRAGESKTVDKIAAGTSYKVVETDIPEHYKQVGAEGVAGMISAGTDTEAVVTNKYTAPAPDKPKPDEPEPSAPAPDRPKPKPEPVKPHSGKQVKKVVFPATGDSTCAIEIVLGSAGALVTLAGLWLAFDRSRS